MTMRARSALALLAAAAVAGPGVANAATKAESGSAKGQAMVQKAKGKKKAKPKPVNYLVRGVYDAADASVTVSSGNAHARRGGLIGDRMVLDLSAVQPKVADTDGDGAQTAADLVTGDKLTVKLRLPRLAPGDGPFTPRSVVDRTNPPVEEEEDAQEAEPAA